MAANNDPIVEFIEAALPAGVRKIYEVVAGLEFPITDSVAYRHAVDAAIQREPAALARFLKTALSPAAFPLLSAQGALEKLNEALPAPVRMVPSAQHRPSAPIAPWGPRGIYPPGRELLPPWYDEAVCLRQCDDRLLACVGAAPDDIEAVIRCVDDHRRCRDRCSPMPWW